MRMFTLGPLAALLLFGCSDEVVHHASPVSLTSAANGHYCQMTVVDHPGPKAQVHLANHSEPLWFTQVRDAFAYQRSPEASGEILAIYVSDMGVADSWEDPGSKNWIEVDTAYFVIGSVKRGVMGAPELVPFADADAATMFTSHNGGSIIRIDDIDDGMVLDPVEVDPGIPQDVPPDTGHGDHGAHGPAGGA